MKNPVMILDEEQLRDLLISFYHYFQNSYDDIYTAAVEFLENNLND